VSARRRLGAWPYRLVHHPIDTGILGLLPGTALVSGGRRALFGARYDESCRRTEGLPPRIG
jgi:hypothetical protein